MEEVNIFWFRRDLRLYDNRNYRTWNRIYP